MSLFNRNIYNVDFSKFVAQRIKGLLFKEPLKSYVLAIISPFVELHQQFDRLRKETDYRLKITPQVCYLEKALNDKYDIANRRIYITGGLEYDAWVLFTKAEAKKKVLYTKSENIHPVVLRTKDEAKIFGVDFVINVPVVISFNQDEMIAFISAYCLPLKYRIKFI